LCLTIDLLCLNDKKKSYKTLCFIALIERFMGVTKFGWWQQKDVAHLGSG
jgi:hypothetical protein